MFELVIVVCLILLNGVFSLSELAVVSARKGRLKTMADQGLPGARAALDLADNPGRFLSTVQIGITLIGILAGAFSGAALGRSLTDALIARGIPAAWSDPLGYGLVIGAITYLSVVVGELVPKHLALANPERVACLVAPAMRIVSGVGTPVVWLLDASTKLIFRLFGHSGETAEGITDEELRSVMAEAATAGVIERDEHKMISGVLRLGDRAVKAVMTPRTEVESLDLDRSEAEIRTRLLSTRHSRLPVRVGTTDSVIGVLQMRELLPILIRGEPLDLRAHVRAAPVIPDTVDALDALMTLREAEVPMALVHDEYGHFEGVVTPADILDAIAGAFRSDDGGGEEAVRRADGSWLISGWMPVDEMADRLGIRLPERRGYETVAGLVLSELRHLPVVGESVACLGWSFEVVDLDGRRIDRLLVSPTSGTASALPSSGG